MSKSAIEYENIALNREDRAHVIPGDALFC